MITNRPTPTLANVRNYALARYLEAQRADMRCDSLESHWQTEIRYYAALLGALDALDVRQGIVRPSLGYRAWAILWRNVITLGRGLSC